MKKSILVICCILWSFFASSQSMTKLICYAPAYVGEKVEVYAIDDYFSMKEKMIASAVVKEDSMVTINFFNSKIQKVYLKSKNNKGFIYIQPNATYEIFMPAKNPYDEYRPLGNDVEISFYNLGEKDINYRILSFDKWKNDFLGEYFYIKNLRPDEFSKHLDTFRMNVTKAYIDDTNFFLQTYVRFSMAELDDIQMARSHNRFQKYDFYIRSYPIMYDNDVYMAYLDNFYKNINAYLTLEANNRIYLGVLKSSPTVIANTLSKEYTLKNAKLVELVMIKMLSDSYFKSDYPQTNIISILDSLSKHPLFKENGVIAGNLIEKLKEIVPGSKAPSFYMSPYKSEQKISLDDFKNKHLYIQFVDLSIKECEQEIDLLKPLHLKYLSDVEVISVFKKQNTYSPQQEQLLKSITWKKFEVDNDNALFKDYRIQTFPSYVLIDAYGYIVASPALKPSPNGKYETIDKSFFYIQKMNEEEKK